ncbi:MAG TPA: hypothetical protein VH969_16165 [Actinophytocola sp.]|jgi:hypothetical protein|uniref:hypothetical protein n=1 Tax=Actinophytocola sp. TaxID=1872138 RepID=UPI002F93D150
MMQALTTVRLDDRDIDASRGGQGQTCVTLIPPDPAVNPLPPIGLLRDYLTVVDAPSTLSVVGRLDDEPTMPLDSRETSKQRKPVERLAGRYVA